MKSDSPTFVVAKRRPVVLSKVESSRVLYTSPPQVVNRPLVSYLVEFNKNHKGTHYVECNVLGCHRIAKIETKCLVHADGWSNLHVARPKSITTCRYRKCPLPATAMKYCAEHVKGRQCQKDGCWKYALRGGFCIAHGGGKPCANEHCTTIAQSGGFCKAHGGGSRCRTAGCDRIARKYGRCIRHGGRNVCTETDCFKSAHGGGKCIAHVRIL